MAKECSICKLPINKRLLIEEKLLNGASYASISRDTGLSEWSISNHFKNHLTDEQHADAKDIALLDSDDWMDNVNAMIGLAKSAIREAKRKAHLGMVLQAMERLEKLYQLKKDLQSKTSSDFQEIDWSKFGKRLGVEGLEMFRYLLAKGMGEECEPPTKPDLKVVENKEPEERIRKRTRFNSEPEQEIEVEESNR